MSGTESALHSTSAELTNSIYMLWAFIIGGLSAVSLPLGSFFGIFSRPPKSLTSALTAFGGGALLAALTIELVAPTAIAITGIPEQSQAETALHLIILIFGCITGGILFVILDQLINEKGGYLRKSATTIAHFSHRKRKRVARLLSSLGRIEFLRKIPPEEVEGLVSYLRPVAFAPGRIIFDQGEPGNRLYFIERGQVNIIRDEKELTTLGDGDLLGEIALVTDSPRTARAVSRTGVHAIELLKEDFDKIRPRFPELDAAIRKTASHRLEEIAQHAKTASREAEEWAESAATALRLGHEIPTVYDVRQSAKAHSGAPLAIWLGIFLDGIPESLVIGAAFLGIVSAKFTAAYQPGFTEVVPYTLIFGLFLSNFPEALSSSIGMRDQGWKKTRIFTLWFSLMLMTALGAAFGFLLGSEINHTVFIGIEGIAAGAMLTMIAQTMIPEAVHLGTPTIVGLSTLSGFLSAVAFKLLEGQ